MNLIIVIAQDIQINRGQDCGLKVDLHIERARMIAGFDRR